MKTASWLLAHPLLAGLLVWVVIGWSAQAAVGELRPLGLAAQGVAVLVGLVAGRPLAILLGGPRRRVVAALAGTAALWGPLTPLGVTVNGAKVGVSLPAVGVVQLVPLGSVLLAVAVASHMAAERQRLSDTHERRVLVPVAAVVAVGCAGLAFAADFGPLLMLLGSSLLIAASTTSRARPLIAIGAAGAGLAGLAAVSSGHVRTRLADFVADNGRASDVLAFWHDMSWFGDGAGSERLASVTFAETDFVLVALVDAYGVVALAVWGVAAAVVCAGLLRAANQLDVAHAGPLLGVAAWLTTSTVVAVLMQSGAVPPSGVRLPLLTRGFSGLVVEAFAVGAAVTLAAGPAASERRGMTRTIRAVPGLAVVVAAVVLTVATVVSGPAVPAEAIGRHLLADSLVRGAVLDRDGMVVTARSSGGGRPVGVPQMVPLVGVADRNGTVTGVEATMGSQLRCGGRRGPVGLLAGRCVVGDVVVTADVATQVLAAELARASGAAVLLADRTGGLIAAADPSTPVLPVDTLELSAEAAELVSPALFNRRPGGSVMKLVLAWALLPDDPDRTWADTASYTSGAGVEIVSPAACGAEGWADILIRSCNTAAAAAAESAPQAVAELWAALGLSGEPSGSGRSVPVWPSDAPSAVLPDVGGGDFAAGAIGQHPTLLSLPQLAMLSMPAFDGTVPAALRLAGDPADRVRVIDGDDVDGVLEHMRGCVTDGTCGTTLAALPFDVGAKSGTAGSGDGRSGSCTGFAHDPDHEVVDLAEGLVFAVQLPGGVGSDACDIAGDLLAVHLAAE